MPTLSIPTNFSADDLFDHSSELIKPDICQIVHIICQIVIFCIGLNIQINIIYACNEEKGKTWKIHVSHAIVTTVYYGFFIPFQSITTFVPSLSIYTGCWICYVASFVSFYCYHAIVVNSLQVAIMKYVFIVNALKARAYGEAKIQKIFFWINLMLPLILSIIALLTTNFQTRSALKSCFGGTDHHSLIPTNSSSRSMNFFTCANLRRSDYDTGLYYVLQFLCVTRKIINWIIVSNLPEGYFYYKIFSAMKK